MSNRCIDLDQQEKGLDQIPSRPDNQQERLLTTQNLLIEINFYDNRGLL
jgi:hypothetical protein